MTEVSSLRLTEEWEQNSDTLRQSHRLEILQDQFRRANRRAAGPFSHPYATSGSLSKLREQIRDVSRIADAVLLSAESAGPRRSSELCSDLKGLLQTQQGWTDRLENQIWRLESQAALMQRLKQLLLDRPPGNEELWALCERIARDTQALPTGLLLLPEPGHRLLLSGDIESSRSSWAIEQARLAVFSAVTLLPDVRGADIVAQTLHSAFSQVLASTHLDQKHAVFSQPQWLQRAAIASPTSEMRRLIKVAGCCLTATETLSQTAVDNIAPPAIQDFFSRLPTAAEKISDGSEPEIAMAHAICHTLGLSAATSQIPLGDYEPGDDAAIVLTHKLRWHDAASVTAKSGPRMRPARAQRPHLSATGLPATSLTVFARED